ncbi:MAG: TIGR00730 family Rossman fold protein [Verrucomicrobiaceae bacterium]|nr:MAG: TIGR00730 family Rossman fold protein [Verrucomicrobiaceae bacterium]
MVPPAEKLPEKLPIPPAAVAEEERYQLTLPDRRFLSGPNSRWEELKTLGLIMLDFLRGLRTFHFVGPCVTVFGSARLKEGHPWYELARRTAGEIARLGFTVMTGGGPGIMEAANRGAREAGGRSVGINIVLPHEQHVNPYLDAGVDMRYFFTRKTLLIKYSYAFVVMPGGIGTMDELFEALTLIQTKKIRNFPVILMGVDYWAPMMSAILRMEEDGLISPVDLDLLVVTDSIPEAMRVLQEKAIVQFNLKRVKIPQCQPLLGEKRLFRGSFQFPEGKS